MAVGLPIAPESLHQELAAVLNRVFGSAAVEHLPEYPTRNVGRLRELSKKTAPRLRRRFAYAAESADDEDELALLASSVAHACEDVFALVTALKSRAREAAERAGLDGGAAAAAVESHPQVQRTLESAVELVRRLDESVSALNA